MRHLLLWLGPVALPGGWSVIRKTTGCQPQETLLTPVPASQNTATANGDERGIGDHWFYLLSETMERKPTRAMRKHSAKNTASTLVESWSRLARISVRSTSEDSPPGGKSVSVEVSGSESGDGSEDGEEEGSGEGSPVGESEG